MPPYRFHAAGRLAGASSSVKRRWRVSDAWMPSIYSLYCFIISFPFVFG